MKGAENDNHHNSKKVPGLSCRGKKRLFRNRAPPYRVPAIRGGGGQTDLFSGVTTSLPKTKDLAAGGISGSIVDCRVARPRSLSGYWKSREGRQTICYAAEEGGPRERGIKRGRLYDTCCDERRRGIGRGPGGIFPSRQSSEQQRRRGRATRVPRAQRGSGRREGRGTTESKRASSPGPSQMHRSKRKSRMSVRGSTCLEGEVITGRRIDRQERLVHTKDDLPLRGKKGYWGKVAAVSEAGDERGSDAWVEGSLGKARCQKKRPGRGNKQAVCKGRLLCGESSAGGGGGH